MERPHAGCGLLWLLVLVAELVCAHSCAAGSTNKKNSKGVPSECTLRNCGIARQRDSRTSPPPRMGWRAYRRMCVRGARRQQACVALTTCGASGCICTAPEGQWASHQGARCFQFGYPAFGVRDKRQGGILPHQPSSLHPHTPATCWCLRWQGRARAVRHSVRRVMLDVATRVAACLVCEPAHASKLQVEVRILLRRSTCVPPRSGALLPLLSGLACSSGPFWMGPVAGSWRFALVKCVIHPERVDSLVCVWGRR